MREHWRAKHARHKKLKDYLTLQWRLKRPEIALPCIIRMTRLSIRQLDDDNLQGAFKSFRDYVADLILPGLQMGRADNDPRLKFEYAQLKQKPSGVLLEIFKYEET